MHGVVAIQELIIKYEELMKYIDSLDEKNESEKRKVQAMLDELHRDADEATKYQLELAQMERDQAVRQADVDKAHAELEQALLSQQLAMEREMMEYEAQLARERMTREEELARRNAEEAVRRENELAERRELYSKETAEALEALRAQQSDGLETKKLELEKKRIEAEMVAKAAQEKLNEEMELNRLKMQSRLDTDRMITGIKTISNQVSMVLKEIISQPKQVAMIAAIIVVVIVLYYLVKESMKLLRQLVQSRLGRPSLVRETSYQWSVLPNFILTFLDPPEKLDSSRKRLEEEFKNIILSKEDKERVLNLALATRNTRQSGAPYRHVLLHGPPGTGKTLAAKRLAASSGMDYAIMSGGDVGPLGEDAVSQLHGLFRWAERSRKGLLVFIDEAEAFLSARTALVESDSGSEVHVRNALNALLYQTGTPSRSFMLVLATNRPQDLDTAVLDRMDVSIPIRLPELPQRVALVRLYMKKQLLEVAAKSQIRRWWQWLPLLGSGYQPKSVKEECSNEECVKQIAQKVNGFSGREIAKTFVAAQYAMYLAQDCTISKQILMAVVQTKINEHTAKRGGFDAAAGTAAAAAAASSSSATARASGGGGSNGVATSGQTQAAADEPSLK